MKRILIIEGDPKIANTYGNEYSRAGFEIAISNDGKQGLDLVATFKPDLVHLDLLVPGADGVEIIKSIRSQPGSQTLPIVVLSNTYRNRLVKDAFDAGANQCVSKAACTPTAMLQIVTNLLARADAVANRGRTEKTPWAATSAAAGGLIEAPRVANSQAELRRAFLERGPRTLAALLEEFEALVRAGDEPARLLRLAELCRSVHSLAGNAGIAGLQEMAQMAHALVALLKGLGEKPEYITPSAYGTLAQGNDILCALFKSGSDAETEAGTPAVALVVDCEIMSRRAICAAMEGVNMATVSVDDPHQALRLLSENQFGLIFLGIEMPGMSGFELCAALRRLPSSKTTPVIFITSLTDFGSRARSKVCGANDLIAKPFLPMELAVKALRHHPVFYEHHGNESRQH